MTPPNPPTCKLQSAVTVARGVAANILRAAELHDFADELEHGADAELERKNAQLSTRMQEQSAELAELRGRVAWVPVGERLPDERQVVLMLIGQAPVRGHHDSIGWFVDTSIDYETGHAREWTLCEDAQPTHWMPLPPLPLSAEPPKGNGT